MKNTFTITNAAANRINQLIAAEGYSNCKLRIEVMGGGCSGFQYNIFLDDQIASEGDIIFTEHEAEVIIHTDCMPLLNNSILEYIEDLGSSRFEVINPNAAAKCGCGKSFGI